MKDPPLCFHAIFPLSKLSIREIGDTPHPEPQPRPQHRRVTMSSMDSSRDSNGASVTSDYVLSTDSTTRFSSDMPSATPFVSLSTDAAVPVDDVLLPNNRPIFRLNTLCFLALLYPITLVIYLLIGAAVFSAIEHEQEVMERREAEDEIQKVISKVAGKYNLSESTTERIFNDFTSLCTNNRLQIRNASFQWTFLPSFYFAATVITAIGKA